QTARAHSTPLVPFEPNTGCIARKDIATSALRDRQAARDPTDALHDDDRTSPERRLRQTSPDRATRRKLDAAHANLVHNPGRRSDAAAAAARGGDRETGPRH